MTAAKTPSQRGASNRRRGLTAERDLCRWLRANGWPQAERAVRTGFRVADRTSADPGDVTGTPLIVWSVKDCAVEQIAAWFAELDAMANGADTDVLGLLVHKRRGHADPSRWWCWLSVSDFLLLRGVHHAGPERLRMELGDLLGFLHAAGYGDPQAVAS